jgi:hypothetical protein
MIRSLIRFAALAAALGALAGSALATQVVQRTPQELAAASTLVVDGRVTSVRSYWNEDHSKILTEAVVTVGETHKGPSGSTVRVVQLGGVVGNVRQTAHGALGWKRGEEVLLFLEPAMPGAYQVAGFSQGKYLIEHDAATGRAYVQKALPADAGAPAPGASVSSGERPARLTVQQFLEQVMPRE